MTNKIEHDLRTSTMHIRDTLFGLLGLSCVCVALTVLVLLLIDVCLDGIPRINPQFLTSFPSRFPHKAGIVAGAVGSLWMMALTALIAVPVGVGAAIYLEEYAPKNRFTRFLEFNIANLAAVPSIIYGLLGLQIFVRALALERSLLSGSLTMSLLILPIVIIAAREAIEAVPVTMREAAIALGATKWQTIRDHVIPLAAPGIMTGCILAFSRAIGETAPLVAIGALGFLTFLPENVFSSFTVIPIQIFNWISRPQEEFHANAAGAIVVLLVLLLCFNLFAVYLRNRFQKRLI